MVQTAATEATQALNGFWPRVAEEVKTLNNVTLSVYILLACMI